MDTASCSAGWIVVPRRSAIDIGRDKVRAAASRLKKARKQPTSIALDPAVIRQLRREALDRGIPYQVLMRMLIVEGLKNLKKAR